MKESKHSHAHSIITVICLVILTGQMCLVSSSPSMSQEQTEKVTPPVPAQREKVVPPLQQEPENQVPSGGQEPEKPPVQKEPETSPAAAQNAKINVYLQGFILSNTNNPASGLNDFRLLDPRPGFLSPDILEVRCNQDAVKGRLGYKVKIVAGEIGKKIHARGLGDPGDVSDFTEFTLSYIVPVGNGLKVEAGKMNTHIGAESLEAYLNPNYSRSFLWAFAEPTTHTGVKLSYDLSPQMNLAGHVYNGWDNFSDNNISKTLGLTLSYTPSESTSFYFNVLNGPEKDFNDVDNRFLFDGVASFKLSKKLSLLANYDYGREQNYLPTGGDAIWEGFALAGIYEFNNSFSLGFRGEVFSDHNGFRTGFPQTLREFTITPRFKIGQNLQIWPEYRFDWSNIRSFNGGTSNNQGTLGIGVMLSF
jgi:hypothetical protein